ncbi:hypothetical protein AHAS_Ahas20G0312200 [Arachis hypogaea]
MPSMHLVSCRQDESLYLHRHHDNKIQLQRHLLIPLRDLKPNSRQHNWVRMMSFVIFKFRYLPSFKSFRSSLFIYSFF